jgi:CelD/BcsL family acetyltransferase involved in cellulose biosynthesis
VVVVPADAPADALPVAIVPFMHRHAVEPSDAATRTRMRHGDELDLTPIPPHAKAIYFGATYHADYSTILTAPSDLPAVSEAVAAYLDSPAAGPWDAVDLRRLRCGDPVASALAGALADRELANGWTLNVEREDVCPVVALPVGGGVDDFLGTLGKKTRHEIRRKVRRAEAVGEVRLDESDDPVRDLAAFSDLHQKRWGADGLFPPTPGGEQSRIFVRRLFEAFGPGGPIGLTFLTVGGRRVAAGIHFETPDGYLFYNAGVDPDAFHLSPGVLMMHRYIARALAVGKSRFDLLRGNEPYKYDWGAVDEPIQRILVRRGS